MALFVPSIDVARSLSLPGPPSFPQRPLSSSAFAYMSLLGSRSNSQAGILPASWDSQSQGSGGVQFQILSWQSRTPHGPPPPPSPQVSPLPRISHFCSELPFTCLPLKQDRKLLVSCSTVMYRWQARGLRRGWPHKGSGLQWPGLAFGRGC